jgi:hypothetical protein
MFRRIVKTMLIKIQVTIGKENIPRKPTEPSLAKSGPEKDTENRQSDSCDDQNFAEAFHLA